MLITVTLVVVGGKVRQIVNTSGIGGTKHKHKHNDISTYIIGAYLQCVYLLTYYAVHNTTIQEQLKLSVVYR